jgi:hypothetical protein
MFRIKKIYPLNSKTFSALKNIECASVEKAIKLRKQTLRNYVEPQEETTLHLFNLEVTLQFYLFSTYGVVYFC